MAIRQTTHVLKNSDIVNRPLPSSLLPGEPIVNTADGIMYFSGVTTSTAEWTPAGAATNFFEVGSNLYDLKLRNQIIEYQGVSGAGLVGKFLSGTTSGFVLADISSIQGIDSYVTGATFNNSNNLLTLSLNNGQPNVTTTIDANHNLLSNLQGGTAGEYYHTTQNIHDALTGATNPSTSNTFVTQSDLAAQSGDTFVTGNTLTAANNNTNTQSAQLEYNVTPAGGPYFIVTQNTFVTGGTVSNGILTLDYNDSTITGNSIDLSGLDVNDTFVTGFTYNNANTFTISRNEGQPDLTATINTVTGMTNTGNLDLQGELANSTGNVVINDNLDITGTTTSWGNILPGAHLTYDLGAQGQRWDELWVRKIQIGTTTTTLSEEGGNFEMSGNTGDFVFWNIFAGDISATGLTISGLGSNRVVYTDGSGGLTTEAGFEYNDTTDLLTVGDINVTNAQGNPANIGQGGLIIGSGGSTNTPGIGDLIVHGDFTVFGTATTVSTNELYVEDPQITLNYNPTGDTSSTSVASGIRIQDGNGTSTGDTYLTIGQMQNLTGIVAGETPDTSEYTGLTGYENRGWVTQLNDIVIRNNNLNNGSPNGTRVLAEFDVLDGGTY
jgi:hypothetical protein